MVVADWVSRLPVTDLREATKEEEELELPYEPETPLDQPDLEAAVEARKAAGEVIRLPEGFIEVIREPLEPVRPCRGEIPWRAQCLRALQPDPRPARRHRRGAARPRTRNLQYQLGNAAMEAAEEDDEAVTGDPLGGGGTGP